MLLEMEVEQGRWDLLQAGCATLPMVAREDTGVVGTAYF